MSFKNNYQVRKRESDSVANHGQNHKRKKILLLESKIDLIADFCIVATWQQSERKVYCSSRII
jgi:hypothetical protein